MKKNHQLSGLMLELTNKNKKKIYRTFRYNVFCVKPTDTPDSLEMENNDVINVFD